MVEFETIIGIEVHAQLQTKSKLFCGCANEFAQQPNTNICAVCMGLPGVLPVANKSAIAMVVKTGLALNCEISLNSIFARKNYYYPDLPKNYQISQYEEPLCKNGFLEIETQNKKKKIKIRRVHLEEDAGKLIHLTGNKSAVDYNRTGIPLMEIVTEADINSPEEAHKFLTSLRQLLRYLEVCDGNMEEGHLRCEPNISLRPKGQKKLGSKTELKNLNSFKTVLKGLEYEVKRQTDILQNGGKVVQQTLRFLEDEEKTVAMRSKEEAHDYRYFPDPDLLPIILNESFVKEIKNNLIELPLQKKERFINQYNIPEYDAQTLTASKELADYYEETVKKFNQPKKVSNWIMSELLKLLNENNLEIKNCKTTPQQTADLLSLIEKQIISGKIAKDVYREMFLSGEEAQTIVEKKGLVQISDEQAIKKVCEEVINENENVVNDYKNGKEKALGFLVGQIMKKTKGKANPELVNQTLKKLILSYK